MDLTDYKVGSVADLIRGVNTPNKPSVVKKIIPPKTSSKFVDLSPAEKTPGSDKKISKKRANPKQGTFEKSSKKLVFNKRKSVIPGISSSDSSTKNKASKRKPNKSESDMGLTIDFDEMSKPSAKKLKVKTKKTKKVASTQNENVLGEAEPEPVLTSVKQKSLKRKRTKSESTEGNIVPGPVVLDGLDQVTSEDAEPSPKKSKNETNAEKRIKNKDKPIKEKIPEDPEVLARTIFVGNLPLTETVKSIKQLFSKYGTVETVRIRGVPVADPKTPKKVALITKKFHPRRSNFFAYVKFATAEDAQKAAKANGLVYNDHHLRVHVCGDNNKVEENKAIFVGNISYDAVEDDLWRLFEPCGAIASVRIVRDSRTGMGKGFGYVNFKRSDSVQLALEMGALQLNERELRVSACNIGAAKKNKKHQKNKKIEHAGKPKRSKEERKARKEARTGENSDEITPVRKEAESFQGVELKDKKKKKKLDKGLLKKKKMMKKLLPKANSD